MLTTVILVIVLPLIILKLYNKFTVGRNYSYTCLMGKTIIITGANTGIGLTTALDFAKRGARVILACRNLEKGERARKLIIEETDNENVVLKRMDLSSLKSVQNFANDINKNEERLDILVNNAGGTMFGNNLTEDGLQLLMQTNHFASFLLTLLLLDKLKQSQEGRIVNVSSTVAYFTTVSANELNEYPSGIRLMAENSYYAKSKLCNVLFTIGLADRLRDTKIIVNCCHPGVIKSGFLSRFPRTMAFIGNLLIDSFGKNTEEGAQTSIYLATSKEIANQSGYYFMDCKKTNYHQRIDKVLVEEVWKKTEETLAGCGFPVTLKCN